MLIIGIISIVAFVFITISLVGETKILPENNNSSPTPPSTSTSVNPLEEDYSHINKIIPGKTNFADAQRINGNAASEKRENGKTYLFYNTPVDGYRNVIAVQNNIVVYSTEHVYGDYRKNVSEFENEFGSPSLTLYDQADSYPWDIFLTHGIGIKNDGKDVGEILYFIPMSQQSFMSNIASELNLSTTPSAEAN